MPPFFPIFWPPFSGISQRFIRLFVFAERVADNSHIKKVVTQENIWHFSAKIKTNKKNLIKYKPIILETLKKKILTVVIDKNLQKIQLSGTDEYVLSSDGFFISSKTDLKQKSFSSFRRGKFEPTGCEFVAPSIIKSSEECSGTSSFSPCSISLPPLGFIPVVMVTGSVLSDPNT